MMQRRVAVVALVAGLAATPALAQQNPFAGSWRGAAQVGGQVITFNMVMGADGRYSQQQVMSRYMVQLTGRYSFPAQNVIGFQVEDWQPRTMPVYHPTGTTGGYYTQDPIAKPPGGTFRYHFSSANAFTIQDVNLGGTVTFNRVR